MTFFRGHKSAFVADFVNFAKNNALKSVELLAPAKDFQSAVAAVDYGADAVYIGGAKFGARYAAGNSAGEIARVVEYAHRYGVRVHATLNTLIYDDELEAAGRQARELIAAGVDALTGGVELRFYYQEARVDLLRDWLARRGALFSVEVRRA